MTAAPEHGAVSRCPHSVAERASYIGFSSVYAGMAGVCSPPAGHARDPWTVCVGGQGLGRSLDLGGLEVSARGIGYMHVWKLRATDYLWLGQTQEKLFYKGSYVPVCCMLLILFRV